MCDHYTNEVNGSAVLTIRWMPPSGTVPLYGCVLLLGASFKLFLGGCVYSPQHQEHKKVVVARLSPRLPPSQQKPLHVCFAAALNRPEMIFELNANGCDKLLANYWHLFGGVIVFSFFFLLITKAKTSQAFYKLGFCLCPAAC